MSYVPLDRPAKEVLADLINAKNPTIVPPLSIAQFTLGEIEPGPWAVDSGSANTRVSLYAAGDAVGAKHVFYDRLDINEFFSILDVQDGGDGNVSVNESTVGTGLTLRDAVSALATKYNIGIDVTQLDNTSEVAPIDSSLTIPVSADYVWQDGNLTFAIDVPVSFGEIPFISISDADWGTSGCNFGTRSVIPLNPVVTSPVHEDMEGAIGVVKTHSTGTFSPPVGSAFGFDFGITPVTPYASEAEYPTNGRHFVSVGIGLPFDKWYSITLRFIFGTDVQISANIADTNGGSEWDSGSSVVNPMIGNGSSLSYGYSDDMQVRVEILVVGPEDLRIVCAFNDGNPPFYDQTIAVESTDTMSLEFTSTHYINNCF